MARWLCLFRRNCSTFDVRLAASAAAADALLKLLLLLLCGSLPVGELRAAAGACGAAGGDGACDAFAATDAANSAAAAAYADLAVAVGCVQLFESQDGDIASANWC